MIDYDAEVETASQTEEYFFTGDVVSGLEKVRARLLDLTNKNRLLNFRYPTKPTKSLLRVVDELHDVLFEKLRDGKELAFKAVPEPVGWDRRTSNEKGLVQRGLYSESNIENQSFDSDFANSSQSSRKPSAVQYAESLGINTSYEMPEESLSHLEPLTRKHTDKYIQTLRRTA